MNLKLKVTLLIGGVFSFLFVSAQEMNAQSIGGWKQDDSGTPYFSYTGSLPYSVNYKNGDSAVINEDPYFLFGNYMFKAFTHISGEYEVYSTERVISHFNKKENTSASISINGKEQLLTGVHSIAGNPNKTKRNFGFGYSEYSYQLENDISLKRMFSVASSEEINLGLSGLRLSIIIKNNGSKDATISYAEMIEVAYEQITHYDKKQLKYTSNFTKKNQSVYVDFDVVDREKYFPIVGKNDKSTEEFYPPIFFIKSLNGDTNQSIIENKIKNSIQFVLKPNTQKKIEFIIGYSVDQDKEVIETICKELSAPVFNPNTNEDHVAGVFVNDWKEKINQFDGENDEDLRQELMWHNYNLEALATYSHYFKETFIPQATMYFFSWGIRAAPRDHLQHALAACYTNPELAKSIMRYTLKKSFKNGNIPFQDKGYGQATSKYMYTSDQELYFLMLVSEYLRITADYDFLKEEVAYFSSNEKTSVLKRIGEYYTYFKEEVGLGPKGLVKLRNSDWNDLIFYKMNSKYNASFNSNESHMNTTMLVSFFDRLANELTKASNQSSLNSEAVELRTFSNDLMIYRAKVWEAYLKDHGDRTFSKRMHFAWNTIGDDNMFLEPQGFLMQIEEYGKDRKKVLYGEIKNRILDSEKIGARQEERMEISEEFFGSRENGGFWYSLNGPLVIGLSTWNLEAAWELFNSQTLKNQAEQFPNYWSSYWTSFDSLDSSLLPSEGMHAQQRFPATMKTTYCAHIHAWLIYEYMYLKEVESEK